VRRYRFEANGTLVRPRATKRIVGRAALAIAELRIRIFASVSVTERETLAADDSRAHWERGRRRPQSLP
jgi:hypothetical protein